MKLDMQKVEIAMGESGFNFSTLAIACGVSRTTLSCIRNGKSCKPDIGGRIAKGLNVPLQSIIEDTAATVSETK